MKIKPSLSLLLVILLFPFSLFAEESTFIPYGLYYVRHKGLEPYYGFVDINSNAVTIKYYQKENGVWYHMESDTMVLLTQPVIEKLLQQGDSSRAIKLLFNGNVFVDVKDKKAGIGLDETKTLRIYTEFTGYYRRKLLPVKDEQTELYEYLKLNAAEWEERERIESELFPN